MSKPLFNERELTIEVSELLKRRRFKTARMLLQEKLVQGASLSTRQHKILLDNLIRVEIVARRPLVALEVLERRRFLGYDRWTERLDADFEAASLLAQSGQLFAARAELIKLFTSRKYLQWDGLLQALELYFNTEKGCQECLEPILEAAYTTAILKYSLSPLLDSGEVTLEETVRSALASYRSASQKYQELLLRAYTDTNDDGRAALVRDLQGYISSEKVGFFNDQARTLLARLTKSSLLGEQTVGGQVLKVKDE